jgi:hypothetical protein
MSSLENLQLRPPGKPSDPRRKRSAQTDLKGKLPKVQTTRAPNVTLMIDNIRGEQYSAKEVEEVRRAVHEAEQADAQLEADVTFESPFVRRRDEDQDRPAWRDMRNAITAFVDGGIGPIMLYERGDIGVTTHVMKHKNKYGKPRFTYTIGMKQVVKDWESSRKYWLYNYECSKEKYTAVLVPKLKAHSELEGWNISDLGVIPMDRVTTRRAIYDHLVRQQKAGKLDLANVQPHHFFSTDANIKSVESWVDVMTTKLNAKDEEW